MSENKSVLVLGASGMLGNAVLRFMSGSPDIVAWGSVRNEAVVRHFPELVRQRIIAGVDVGHPDELVRLLARVEPDVIINCIGMVKQLADAKDPLSALPINALLPHRLARLAELSGARLIHISTDCVFAGTRGGYREDDVPDALDLYGRSKLLGEVDYPNAITLRTSIIGHELASSHGLVNWFLSQQGSVRGFTHAVFSGLPTVELARVIRDRVIAQPGLHGLYHVSAAPITKYDLLRLVAAEYGKDIRIDPDAELRIDRSLDSTRFRTETGYVPADWQQLVRDMRAFG